MKHLEIKPFARVNVKVCRYLAETIDFCMLAQPLD